MLGISEEEAKGIWVILAAICHLGCAGVAVGKYTIYVFHLLYKGGHSLQLEVLYISQGVH